MNDGEPWVLWFAWHPVLVERWQAPQPGDRPDTVYRVIHKWEWWKLVARRINPYWEREGNAPTWEYCPASVALTQDRYLP